MIVSYVGVGYNFLVRRHVSHVILVVSVVVLNCLTDSAIQLETRSYISICFGRAFVVDFKRCYAVEW